MILLGALGLPVALRLALMVRFRNLMTEVIPEAERDVEGHRSLVQPLAGFSFAAVAAIVVLEPGLQSRYEAPALLFLGSFVGLLWCSNIQAYKVRRWQDEAGLILLDGSTFAMVIGLCWLLRSTGFTQETKWIGYALALAGWGADFGCRCLIEFSYLTHVEQTRSIEKSRR